MKIACICPTRGRPQLVENLLACFCAQDYPAENRRLFILEDDSRQLSEGEYCYKDNVWTVLSKPYWIPSLPKKYNVLIKSLENYNPDAVIVMEDDDLYLSHHISLYADCLATHAWCHPSRVWSTYRDNPKITSATGRFHAALGFQYKAIQSINGWEETDRADFDQRLMRKLKDTFGLNSDPTESGNPSYVFRWADTGFPHGQGQMRNPEDTGWYKRFRMVNKGPFSKHGVLSPQFDPACLQTLRQIEAMGPHKFKR